MSPALHRFEPALPALAFAIFVTLIGPWWSVFELDPDEGFNLMKAVLVVGGHAMFTEIWSDQPPFLTYILALVHHVFGPNIGVARGTILLFSMGLISGLFYIVRTHINRMGAWIAVAVLGAGFIFQSLSVSVMIGLPAVALAMISIALLYRADGERAVVLILSGVVMALALQTKLFVVTALPSALLAAAFTGPLTDVVSKRVARVAIWFGAVLLGWAAIAVVSGLDPLVHLIAPHTDDRLIEAFAYDGGPARMVALLLLQPHYLFMAAVGFLCALTLRDVRFWIPVVWLAISVMALIDHRPLWPHQLMLLFVPMAWLAGGIGSALMRPLQEGLVPRLRMAIGGVAILAMIPFAFDHVRQTSIRFNSETDPIDTAAVANLLAHADVTRWVVTDKPLDAYYAGLRTPPSLAVLSLKRIKGGTLTPDDVLAVIKNLRPEQVSYRRMFMGKSVAAHLKQHYVKVPNTQRHALFIRSDIAP